MDMLYLVKRPGEEKCGMPVVCYTHVAAACFTPADDPTSADHFLASNTAPTTGPVLGCVDSLDRLLWFGISTPGNRGSFGGFRCL